jgi:hypothetical protein
MGLPSLLAESPSALPGPYSPPRNASPADHLAWCIRFGSYCTRQAQLANEFNLPTWKWLREAELSAFAAAIWRERVEGAAP